MLQEVGLCGKISKISFGLVVNSRHQIGKWTRFFQIFAYSDEIGVGNSRSTRKLLLSTVEYAAEQPSTLWKAVVNSAVRDLASENVGARRSARGDLLTIRKMGVDAAVSLDKIDRLDSGGDTERHTLRIVYQNEEANRLSELHDA